jgi:hypothetical protein
MNLLLSSATNNPKPWFTSSFLKPNLLSSLNYHHTILLSLVRLYCLLLEDRSATFEVTYLDAELRITRGDRGELRLYLLDSNEGPSAVWGSLSAALCLSIWDAVSRGETALCTSNAWTTAKNYHPYLWSSCAACPVYCLLLCAAFRDFGET